VAVLRNLHLLALALLASISMPCLAAQAEPPRPVQLADLDVTDSFGVHSPRVAGPDGLDIAEAVFRYQMIQYTVALLPHRIRCFYLVMLDGDPDQPFLDRFKDLETPVRRGAQYNALESFRCSVDAEKRLSRSRAEASGGCWPDASKPYGATYLLERQARGWVVVNEFPPWRR